MGQWLELCSPSEDRGNCSTQGIRRILMGEERGSHHTLQCPSVPGHPLPGRNICVWPWALITFPWPCFPVSPVLGGLPGVSVVPSGPVQGDPHPWAGTAEPQER